MSNPKQGEQQIVSLYPLGSPNGPGGGLATGATGIFDQLAYRNHVSQFKCIHLRSEAFSEIQLIIAVDYDLHFFLCFFHSIISF